MIAQGRCNKESDGVSALVNAAVSLCRFFLQARLCGAEIDPTLSLSTSSGKAGGLKTQEKARKRWMTMGRNNGEKQTMGIKKKNTTLAPTFSRWKTRKQQVRRGKIKHTNPGGAERKHQVWRSELLSPVDPTSCFDSFETASHPIYRHSLSHGR